jgi:hypothetical protein
MSLKPVNSMLSFNNLNTSSFQSASPGLIRSKTQGYSISLPIIFIPKDVIHSNSVFLRHACSKIAEAFVSTIESVKQFNIEESIKVLLEAKYMLETIISNHLDFIRFIDLYNTDDSIIDFVRHYSTVNRGKMLYFTLMLISDINDTLEKLKAKDVSLCDLYAIKDSLMFYRPVNLTDDRFLDDIIDSI